MSVVTDIIILIIIHQSSSSNKWKCEEAECLTTKLIIATICLYVWLTN